MSTTSDRLLAQKMMQVAHVADVHAWRLWKAWVFANGTGALLASFAATVMIPIVALAFMALGKLHDASQASFLSCLAIAIGSVGGALFGATQWYILRSVYPKIEGWKWIAATGLGCLLSWALIFIPGMESSASSSAAQSSSTPAPPLSGLDFFATATAFGAFLGSLPGAAQWMLLRKHTEHASWWLLGTAAAGGVTLPLALLAVAYAQGQASYWNFWLIGVAAVFFLGILHGAITGMVLERLARPRRSC
jgi:hypothetical protein